MFSFELFLLALSFYTRISISYLLDYQKLPQSIIYLPLIGWIVGGLSAMTYLVLSIILPQMTAILLAILTGIFVTGGLHEDGLADVCDGFGGGFEKEQILKIMKDAQIGVFGMLSLFFTIGLKITILNEFASYDIPFILFVGHSVSRFSPLQIMFFYDYARIENSKVQTATKKLIWPEFLFGSFFAFIPLYFFHKQSLLVVLILVFTTFFLGHYFFKKIGGYTGDCLGASQQVSEVIFYLSLSILCKYI